MPANVNNQFQGIVPVGDFIVSAAGAEVLLIIPDNATGVYFQFRNGTGNYIIGEQALAENEGFGFRGNSDQEIRLDLYPGCPVFFSNPGTSIITYQVFAAIDTGSLVSRNR